MSAQLLAGLSWLCSVFVGLLLVSGTAQAGTFRCTGTGGKVVYSDQPCAPDQTGGTVKGIPAAPSAAGSTGSAGRSPSVQDIQGKAQRDRIHGSLSPECQALGKKASQALQSDSDASMDEVKRAVSEFESRCSSQVVEATRKDNARGGSKTQLDNNTCRRLRQALDTARTRLAHMTDKEKIAFATQQNEVSVACP